MVRFRGPIVVIILDFLGHQSMQPTYFQGAQLSSLAVAATARR